MTQLVNVNPRAVINKITQLRCGYGSNIELFQYADTPDEAFEILRNGLTENYLIPEASAAAEQAFHGVLPAASFEDFMGPELARMNKD